MRKLAYIVFLAILLTGCSFLNEQAPQGILSDEEALTVDHAEELVIAAYAVYMSAEDINSSFSMWNFDVRSDDAYKGGNGTSDGDVFHQLEIEQGILTTNWNISDMWIRLYNCLSRTNTAIGVLEKTDTVQFPKRNERLAEMYFLRAYGHFLLKRLYKYIPFAMDPMMTPQQYDTLSNTRYTNDEGWQVIINDLKYSLRFLPVIQADKGRPTQASVAAFLTKVYLYKAYHQDDVNSHRVTSINEDDLKQVIEYSDPKWYSGYGLESDFHNNFRPEPMYENGVESLWAIQYSMNDGTTYGNMNWGYGLCVPNIPGVTDGGCDFYKPSQNLLNAFRTSDEGLPFIGHFDERDLQIRDDNTDPRVFLTIGMPGCPYEFNDKYIMDETSTWSRSNGLYKYNVSLKHNVDPDCDYIKKGAYWASSMNRIVFRYADVLLERAEALCQLNDGRVAEAVQLVNQLRERAANSTTMIADYPEKYGVKKMLVKSHPMTGDAKEALEIVKMERRLELAMESERFFDLVRWGEAEKVLNAYFASEANKCAIYATAHFTADKNEYLPLPFSEVAASNGHYRQNIGGW